jgi:hypothetical protein
MEPKTEFDLNHNIQLWRQTLANSPSFQPENLDELETHIRDSVNTLEAKGLSTEESFFIAVRRLGYPTALEKEFSKVNSQTVWSPRWMWMAVGIFLYLTVLTIKGLIDDGFLAYERHFTVNAHLIGFLNLAAAVLLFAAPIVLLRRVVRFSMRNRSQFIIRTMLNRPAICMAGLVAFNISLAALSLFRNTMGWRGSLNPEQVELIQIVMAWSIGPASIAQLILLPIAVVYLCRRHLKARLASA